MKAPLSPLEKLDEGSSPLSPLEQLDEGSSISTREQLDEGSSPLSLYLVLLLLVHMFYLHIRADSVGALREVGAPS